MFHRLLTNIKDKTYAQGCGGHGIESRLYLQAKIITDVEIFQVTINGSVYNVQCPEKKKK